MTDENKAEEKDSDVPEPPPWRTSAARDVLYDMVLAGKIPLEMKPKQVYLTYLQHLPEFAPYQDYTKLKFSTKMGSACKRAGKKRDRAKEDEEFLKHDRLIFPAPTHDTRNQPIWKGSQAQELLQKALADIASGKKIYKEPRFLYAEEEAWHEHYSLEFFRKKIYQEIKFCKRREWLKQKFGEPMEKETDELEDDVKESEEQE